MGSPTSTLRPFTRIAWAVNPYSEDEDLQVRTVEILRAITAGHDVRIEPISILDAYDMNMGDRMLAMSANEIRRDVEHRVKAWLKSTGLKNLLEPVFLTQGDLSLRNAVRTLLDYVRLTRCDLVAVSTQARKGATRFLLGSFAETLALHSDVPILMVSPHTRPAARIEEVVFSSDMSPASRVAFEKAVPLALESGAKLILFHKLAYFTEFTTTALGASPAYAAYIEDDARRREEEGKEWIKFAESQGVKAEFVLSRVGPSVKESLLSFTRGLKAPIIAMASESGLVASALLGSVTRQVLRQAECPVWVLHPTRKKT